MNSKNPTILIIIYFCTFFGGVFQLSASPAIKLYSLSYLVLSRLDGNETKGLIIGRGSLEGVKRETIKERLALITQNIDKLKLKIGSLDPIDASDQEDNYLRSISNLERNANVLKKSTTTI
ncbi:MAG: hypothetical protein O3A69_09915 [Proteobacteria bacterium]|nr:hypothetical protein [Pseudomonadota bacterium]